MIGVARLHCEKGDQFRLVECPVQMVQQIKKLWIKKGWTIKHQESL